MTEVMTLPNNQEAELAVLGAMLINPNPNATEQVFSLLKPESFYLFAHNKIFQQMQVLHQQNKPIDLIALDESLKSAGLSEQLGGLAYLAELAKRTPSSANLVTYAEIVRDCAIKRFAIATLNECEQMLFGNTTEPAEKLIDAVSGTFSQIGDYAK